MCTLVEAESEFSLLVRHVQEARERVAITRDKKAIAILMSAEELESLEETLAVLSEAGALGEIVEARFAIKAQNLIPAAEVTLRLPAPPD